ncbi:hypothetical protein PAHAL_2G412700 [Panicum hallii]|jgi:hypothetical protein|uniref:Uncharacterized protein n=1 Tax=Panicum hallii TaxID=206008 RepID=A0A2S3H3Q6_9POAL|nr:hypothetical protein PAHAL_2G412700 [Panicum hallii]
MWLKGTKPGKRHPLPPISARAQLVRSSPRRIRPARRHRLTRRRYRCCCRCRRTLTARIHLPPHLHTIGSMPRSRRTSTPAPAAAPGRRGAEREVRPRSPSSPPEQDDAEKKLHVERRGPIAARAEPRGVEAPTSLQGPTDGATPCWCGWRRRKGRKSTGAERRAKHQFSVGAAD